MIEPLGLNANQWQFLSAPNKYVEASTRSGRRLDLQSTRRQFLTARDILARLNGSQGEKERRGILLADDVGLGKTTVAALVAWVVASAGERRGVRILAPNEVMARRWEEELLSHVAPLQERAPALDVQANRVKARRLGRLSPGSIQVVKHSYAVSDAKLACDLLIIDEAHRAKGENTSFSKALRRQRRNARRVLILTATPFSIHLAELQRMLTLIGGDAAHASVKAFGTALDDLYSGNAARSLETVANRLAEKAKIAVDELSEFVIRHGIDDLPREHASFGRQEDWVVSVPDARPEELELILRMDRALRVVKDDGLASSRSTQDSRFDVGWKHFDAVARLLRMKAPRLGESARAVVERHLKSIKMRRKEVVTHSKIEAVGKAVNATVAQGEKVLVFCHHHATAQELTAYLARVVPKLAVPLAPALPVWIKAWEHVLDPASGERGDDPLRSAFIEWLCADLIRAQIRKWLPTWPVTKAEIAELLHRTRCRRLGKENIAEAAQSLYSALIHSRSSRAVLKEAAAKGRLELLPGANGTSRVLGVCEPSEYEDEEWLFMHNQQPDTLISIFNSPFGPDVLVATDRLSEGVDLHRYCRHLIHYELDPSPVRTVQRNGRVRRVGSWSATTGMPILYAYPAFPGTRDQKLVQIMKKRLDSFSLLLGGVQSFTVDDVAEADEKWRNDVIALAKKSLSTSGGQLRAREPGGM